MNNANMLPSWLMSCVANQLASEEWLRTYQQQAGQDFLQQGFPTRRDELWKYTDISFLKNEIYLKIATNAEKIPSNLHQDLRLKNSESILIVLMNGQFIESLSDTRLLPDEVTLCSLHHAFTHHANKVKEHWYINHNLQRFPFVTLNTALVSDGVYLHIPKNVSISVPIHILYLNSHEDNFIQCPRNMIIAEENSEAIILEEHRSLDSKKYFTNAVTDIHANCDARLFYHKIQNESAQSTHIAQIYVDQKKGSIVETFSLAVGARLSREDIFVNLKESNAQNTSNGFYCLSQDAQHIDNHIHIDHTAPHCYSNMYYKGILDKKSRAVFNGKIHVRPDAQKTHSNQANHNLLLSNESEIDTKPEFEIYADDVKCSHGDTVGQLDMDSLFYLRSRGIEKDAAMKMLTHAFAADVMNKITNTPIRQRLTNLLSEKLTYEN